MSDDVFESIPATLTKITEKHNIETVFQLPDIFQNSDTLPKEQHSICHKSKNHSSLMSYNSIKKNEINGHKMALQVEITKI